MTDVLASPAQPNTGPAAAEQPVNNADGEACFICLGGATDAAPELGPLGRHCACPALYSHRSCLLRWQLQQAGKREEKQCRFCNAALQDWREAISDVQPDTAKKPAIMAVVFQGKTVKVPVVTGPAGVAEFKRTVCKLFSLPEGTDFEVTFECKSPVFGDKLHLKGFDCFEAASYCAAVSAAKRASHKAAQRAAQDKAGSGTTAPGATGVPPSPFQSSQVPGSTRSSLSSDTLPTPTDACSSASSRSVSYPSTTGPMTRSGTGGRLGPSPLGAPARSAPSPQPSAGPSLLEPLERSAASILRRVRAGIKCCTTTATSSDGGAASAQLPAASLVASPTTPYPQYHALTSPQASVTSTHSTLHSDGPPAAHVAATTPGGDANGARQGTGTAKPGIALGSTITNFLRRVL